MTQSIKEVFYHAMLARAAYANIVDDRDTEELIQRGQSGMKEKMAQYFTKHFAFFNSSIDNPATGYDGIVFQEKNDDGQLTSHYILANRGTQFGGGSSGWEVTADLAQDLLLGVGGANPQTFYMNALLATIPNSSGVTITTAGHSLGGFLSTWALANSDRVDQSYTYNGAGIGNFLAIGTLVNLLRSLLGMAPASFDGNGINIRTEENFNIVSSAGFYIGESAKVFADLSNPLEATLGHGIVDLSDALLVSYVLSTIDSTISLETTNRLTKASHDIKGYRQSYEVAYLSSLFGYDASTIKKTTDQAILQTNLFGILEKTEGKTQGDHGFEAKIVDLTQASKSVITSTVMGDTDSSVLLRHALLNRSSFAIELINGEKILPSIQAIISDSNYDREMFEDGAEGVSKENNIWVNLVEMHKQILKANANSDLVVTDVEESKKRFVSDWTKEADGKSYILETSKTLGQNASTIYMGSAADNVFETYNGNDLLYGLDGNDTLSSGLGNDYLQGGRGLDALDGGGGNDVLSGGKDNDTLKGGAGNDALLGGADNDYLYGEDDNDFLRDGSGEDYLDGGAGNDYLNAIGDAIGDTLKGGAGNDLLYGGDGANIMSGGDDNDIIRGGAGGDHLSGDGGNDELIGGAQRDGLNGGDGNDLLRAGAGDDVLAGGAGTDRLEGGEGDDTYLYDKANFGTDFIVDDDGIGSIVLPGGTGVLKIGQYDC